MPLKQVYINTGGGNFMHKKLIALGISCAVTSCIIVAAAFLLAYGSESEKADACYEVLYPAYTQSELNAASSLIAVGTVTGVRENGKGQTYYGFETERVMKGDGGRVTIITSAPYIENGLKSACSADIHLAENEKYLVFLSGSKGFYSVVSEYAYRLVQLDDGTYSIRIGDEVLPIDEYCDRIETTLN